jgi:hypothetical protein
MKPLFQRNLRQFSLRQNPLSQPLLPRGRAKKPEDSSHPAAPFQPQQKELFRALEKPRAPLDAFPSSRFFFQEAYNNFIF